MEHIFSRGKDLLPEPFFWLWPQRIPAGAISILDGDPGIGKSLITARLAADISTGNTTDVAPLNLQSPGKVIFIAAEDDLKRQLVPRLLAAGANMANIAFYQGIYHDNAPFRFPEFPTDAVYLTTMIERFKPRLVIIDPITAYLADCVSTVSDSSLRRAVMPFLLPAETTGAAFLIVRHLNKAGGIKALYRGAGSIGLVGVARSVLLAARNPDDPSELVLAHVKSNFGPICKSLAGRINLTGPAPYLTWLGDSDLTGDQLLLVKSPTLPKDAAMELLKTSLKSAGMPMALMQKQAFDMGISERTLWRAKKELGVRSRRCLKDNSLIWFLPKNSTDLGLTPDEEAPFAPDIP